MRHLRRRAAAKAAANSFPKIKYDELELQLMHYLNYEKWKGLMITKTPDRCAESTTLKTCPLCKSEVETLYVNPTDSTTDPTICEQCEYFLCEQMSQESFDAELTYEDATHGA